ncbi:hypothetical protein AMS68_005961 [Peltaster fructicola]|uniref:N-acetyltransferase domain-containing protein n=1 Tax=Peltaster fructicola TaxID=286661 RepID=A0A6H0Y0B9_9PEZI|nr:hypothetical protein AMS68_005961 [Peltaster fructicola]
MYINSNEALSAQDVLLVPYCRHHVRAYHEWMQDADLREATASEELTIEEEYAMQESWRQDHDKLTFIVCKALDSHSSSTQALRAGEADAAEHMVGDINLFLLNEDDDSTEQSILIGEIELMIAQTKSRRQGYGRAALLAFLEYVAARQADILEEHWTGIEATHAVRPSNLAYLRVKINQVNNASISLFESVGFKLVSPTPNYFGELELRVSPDMYLPGGTPGRYQCLGYQDDH